MSGEEFWKKKRTTSWCLLKALWKERELLWDVSGCLLTKFKKVKLNGNFGNVPSTLPQPPILNPNKMSSVVSSSPFVAALPAPNVFVSYDADGDVIMTDAQNGLPIAYGAKRSRAASVDSEDSRASKRSRSSSEEDGAASAAAPAPIAACPPAPKKAPVGPPADEEEDGGASSPVRNLAEAMANAVLEGEPSSPSAAAAAGAGPAAAGAGPAAADGEADGGAAPPGAEPAEEGWCLSVTCSDLALRLDMRHPRVVLNLLRFVETYNELAPYGEEIHMPLMNYEAAQNILTHESVVNPVPEFASEIAELRSLVQKYSCECSNCDPYYVDRYGDGYTTDSSYDRYRRDSF